MPLLNQQLIKSINLKKICSLIIRNAGISRAMLAEKTKLSKATVSALVDELIEKEFVIDCGVSESNAIGRKPNNLIINSTKNCVVVLQWHKTRICYALIGINGKLVYEENFFIEPMSDYAKISSEIINNKMESLPEQSRIIGVCIIVPAIIDELNMKIFSTVLQAEEKYMMVQYLREQIPNFPLIILNDTACYAYAECIENHMEENYFAFINMGRGVGSVLIDNGKIFRAANGMTTQFGHFSIDRNGPICECGNRGCIERLIGEAHILKRAKENGFDSLLELGENASFEHLAKLVKYGDSDAIKLLDIISEDTAYAVSNIISLFNPNEVIFGGDGFVLGADFLTAVGKHLDYMGFKPFTKEVTLRYTALNKSSSLEGAARYYIDRYFRFEENLKTNLYIG